MKEITIPASDGFPLAAALFDCENPKAVLQVIHGAKEYKERYFDLITFLNQNGYAVIISDNRGHGKSVNENYPLGHFDSAAQMVDDQLRVTQTVKALHPDKKLYLYGHSLGSCIARAYLQKNDAEIEKLILTGTVFPAPLCTVGNGFCGIARKIYGDDKAKGILAKLANNNNDKWVCQNPSVMVQYRRDPLVKGCIYTTAAVNTIVALTGALSQTERFRCRNPKLKICSLTGKDDPCTGGEPGLQASFRALRKAGYHHICRKVYPNMRHEVINEKGNAQVYKDMLNFLDT